MAMVRAGMGEATPDAGPDTPIIVGLGASAGGLEAFKSFFERMPADSGMAFVVVLHLPANRRSLLPDILSRWTSMPVLEAVDGMPIRPNCVYVPPPHASAELENGVLRVSHPAHEAPREHRPIDAFFGSLAACMRERSVGIVLSGTGSDGALGLKAIKSCGGLTIAQGQNGDGPQYRDMPAEAIATGAVDLVAAVRDIPGHLLRLRAARLDLPAAGGTEEDTNSLRLRICAILRSQVGHDFSGYKDRTFLRRVNRRMQVLSIPTLAGYVDRLELDREETMLLFRDLLIRVTSFFRDDAAFEIIERVVIPLLFQGRHADSVVRVWVPGCATGEEAYSLAMLMREHIDGMRGPPKIHIFGTDIDEPAIATARLGRYPGVLLENLSPKRRDRFFTRSESGFVVTKELRELCTFSPHSLVRDPPFSHIDLISCRNLLIYLDNRLQNEVIPAFHYALAPDGLLILGISESTSRHDDLFEPLEKTARIFKRRDVRGPPLPVGHHRVGSIFASIPPQPRAEARPRVQSAAATPSPGSATLPQPQPPTPGTGLVPMLARATAALFPGRTEIQALRQQLLATQAELQSVTEEHQTVVEELRSANEELHSVNEELQSTVEELETSKEEIQSVNEELHTVNMRLNEKVEELAQTNSDLRNLFDSTQIATIFLDRHLIVRSFTPAVGQIYNLIPSDVGRPLTDIVSRLRYDRLREDVAEVLATMMPLERKVSGTDGPKHYIMRILPYRAPDSTVSGTLVTFVDVTGIVEAEEQQVLLVDELNHRVKNMLTVVISLASQTLRRSQSLDDFSTAFLGRVHALAASYTLLSREGWHSIQLREVITEELQPFLSRDRTNVQLHGDRLDLVPAGALAVGMAIHELATNAVRYGALSVPDGEVRITWRVEGEGAAAMAVIEWQELSGPPVTAPSAKGFGTVLIERGLAHELGGEATLDFRPQGLLATLRAPITRLSPRRPGRRND
jgi:two-component system CheB/CheR fusion protein